MLVRVTLPGFEAEPTPSVLYFEVLDVEVEVNRAEIQVNDSSIKLIEMIPEPESS
jgi:hypothetical protein